MNDSKWIPVSERLPEENGYYLTTTMHHEVYCDYWEEERFNRTEAVIAWMPKPEPYKAEMDLKKIIDASTVKIGVSADDAEAVCRKMASLLPPIGETEISLIKSNPNISKFQKWRLIRNIRRQKRADGRK